MNSYLIAGIGLATLLLLAGHYGRRYFERELEFETPAVICYSYGTLALWAGTALWLGLSGLPMLAWYVLAIDVASGFLVVGLYGLDGWIRGLKRKSRQRKVEFVERLSDGPETG